MHTAPSFSGLRCCLYTSSLGNYFFREIAELIGAGLEELGVNVRLCDERQGFIIRADWHLIVAPHEFFHLGAGEALANGPWPEKVVLFNTEQPSTQWFALSAKRFPRARFIWDIDFESALRISHQGVDCSYLPLGFAAASPLFRIVTQLPTHEGTSELGEVRDWSGFDRPWGERPLDLLFLGHSSPRREQFFSRHAAALGAFRSHFHKASVARPLIPGQTTCMNTETSVGLAQRSKVLLNVHHGIDKYFEWHRIVLLGIAQKALVVTEPCSLAPPFRANVDFLSVPLDELPSQLRYLLHTKRGQEQAEEIVRQGYQTLTTRCRLSAMLQPLVQRLVDPVASSMIPPVWADAAPVIRVVDGVGEVFRSEPALPLTQKPLSICVVTPDVTGEGREAECGAAQIGLAESLAAAGHHVTLLHTLHQYGEDRTIGHWLLHFQRRGVRYVALPVSRIPSDAPAPLQRSYRTWQWLRAQQFQVVHFPDSLGSAFYSVLGKRQGLGLPATCLNVHAQGPSAWRRRGTAQYLDQVGELDIDFIERESIRLADTLTTPTQYLLQWFRDQGWNLPEAATVRPNLVPRFLAKRSPGQDQAAFELVVIGPQDVAGGIQLVCDALDTVKWNEVAGARLTFLGSRGEIERRKSHHYLRERALKWACQTEVFTSKSSEDWKDYLEQPGRIAIIPPLLSNAPSDVQHCLETQTPFLTIENGGVAELIASPDRARVCFPPSTKALVAALTCAWKNGVRPAQPAVEFATALKDWLDWHEQLDSPASQPTETASDLPLVTVCLVHFNRPQYLRQALQSLYDQDYPNFEVVLVDDGSTSEEAVRFLDSIETTFQKRGWRLLRQENRYLGAARNTGARHARGEYLLFMDDDNYAKPHELSTFVRVAQRTRADILTSAMDLFTGADAPQAQQTPKARWLFLGAAVAAGAYRNIFGDANALVRRSVFEQLGGFTEDYGVTHEDWEFHARAVLEGYKLETIPEALFWYRYTPGSMIHHTPKFANQQRSLRPYLAKIPEPLRDLVQFSQGMKFKLDQASHVTGNYEFTSRLLRSCLSTAKLLAELGQNEAADETLMEVLLCSEGTENNTLYIDALLIAGKTMAELKRVELALKLVERALKIALAAADEISAKAARTLLEAIKRGADVNVACQGMRFLDVESETGFVRRTDSPKLEAPAIVRIPEANATPKSPVTPLPPRPDGTRIRVGFLSVDDIDCACPQIRLQSVLDHLQQQGAVELVSVGAMRNGRFDLSEKALQGLDVVVVQRQMAGLLPFAKLQQLLRGRSAKVVFEIDDALTVLPAWHRAHAAFQKIQPFIDEYLRRADLVTVSTVALQELYAPLAQRIVVVPNCLDTQIWPAAPVVLAAAERRTLLFSGTLDHQQDLQVVEDALLDLFAAYPDHVEFIYWGNITDRLRAHPSVKAGPAFEPNYKKYAARLQSLSASFAIVPLEENPFNQGKSAIKWLEYSACGLPAIFSGVRAYRQHVADGETGLLVPNTREAWFKAMERLVNDPHLCLKLARQAQAVVMREQTVATNAHLWLKAYEDLLRPAVAASSPKNISVSIVIPTFNQVHLTQQCLEALRKNTNAGDYELIVVDNGSTDTTVEFLRNEERQGRLRVVANPRNLGFGPACNQGARLAQGQYIVFLNNDTQVQPGWLGSLVSVAEQDSAVAAVGSKLLFPDGTIQHAGVALAEVPGRDPLLAVHTYYKAPAAVAEANQSKVYPALTAACLLVRTACFEKIGGFDEGYWNGYEDVDLCLQFQHHGWLCVYEPTSQVVHHESQSGPARFQRVQDNIRRLHRKWLGEVGLDLMVGADGKISSLPTSRIRPYHAPSSAEAPLTSIIILTHNQLAHTRKCLASIAAHTSIPHELILVDNGSRDGTVAYLQQWAETHPGTQLILNETNRGFAAGNNQGLAVARGEQVLLLNNDTIVTPGWLKRMQAVFATHPRTGMVGPVSNYVSGPQLIPEVTYKSDQELIVFAKDWAAQHDGENESARRLVGFCMLIRRDVIMRIGGLDEAFGSGNFEDDDFCLRAGLAGFEARIARDVFIHHTGSQTFKGAGIGYRSSMLRNWKLFKAKWGIPGETPIEQGYRLPLQLVNPNQLKVDLARTIAPVTADSSKASETSPARKPVRLELPPVARLGDLRIARELFANKELVASWSAVLSALETRPFHPEAWLLLAEIAWSGGDATMMKQCLQRAEKLTPKWKPVRKFLKKHPVRNGGSRVAFPPLPEAQTQPRLSVCLIVRNEEQFLERCLACVQGMANQIIVVDTGSTDRTVEIAREKGAEVYAFAWNDDFSAARNAALERATGDWILILDADEELRPDAVGLMEQDLQATAVMAYRLPILEVGREEEGCNYVPRLFRNAPGLFFLGRVHEQVFSSLEVRRKEWELENRLGNATLIHHGYTDEIVQTRKKVERNLQLLERAIEELPDEPNLLMNLGLELVRSQRVDEGINRYWQAVRAMSALPADEVVPELRQSLLTQFSTHLVKRQDYPAVISLLQSPLAVAGGLTASLHFALGLAMMESDQLEQAVTEFRHCLATRHQPSLVPINRDIRGVGPRHCLAICLKKLNQPEAAQRMFVEAREEDPRSRPLRHDFARFLAEHEEPVEALKLLHQLVAEDGQDIRAWIAGGQIALSKPEFVEFATDWAGEAFKMFPDNEEILAMRAETLMLNEAIGEALLLWQRLGTGAGAKTVAARILCEIADGEQPFEGPKFEPAVSREFIKWYRRILETEKTKVVLAINDRMEQLRAVLPSAAETLEAVLVSAR